jgi:hypothetical protein
MLTAGLADTATLAFIAPAHNQLAHAAAATYKRQLTDPAAGPLPFITLTLEHAFAALAAAGLPAQAVALHRRYTDWWLLDGELELAMGAAAFVPAAEALAAPAHMQTVDTISATKPVNRSRPQRTRPATRTAA